MKAFVVMALVAVALLAGVGGQVWLRGGGPLEPPPGTAPAEARAVVAANGLVEGASPEAALRPQVAGTLLAVHVGENADVAPGQVLAELASDAERHQVALARAELAAARQRLARLHAGERAEKRRAAAAAAAARQALYTLAKADFERTERGRAAVSPQQRDADRFRVQQLQAEWEQARAEAELVESPARAEDAAVAAAEVDAAEARLALAEAGLARTRLTAPYAGRVLRVLAQPGEAASPTSPQPVILLADLSRRRVRAFMEELDVGRVRPGQAATVTADGLPGRTFPARVGLVLQRMGRRAPQSDAPDELKDLYYREVLLDVDGADDLPVNLRVQVRIEAGP